MAVRRGRLAFAWVGPGRVEWGLYAPARGAVGGGNGRDAIVTGQPLDKWFTVEQNGDVTVVKFTPAEILDEGEVHRIGQALYDLVEKDGCRQLVLNFAQVRLMTSLMLAKLFTLRKKAEAAGARVALCETNPELGEVFDALRLPQLFSIYAEEQDAVSSF